MKNQIGLLFRGEFDIVYNKKINQHGQGNRNIYG